MTPRRERMVSVPRSKSADYAHVADSFYSGAELAKEYEYWNAAGVLIVHAAIAYADAISIKFRGERSKGDDHMAAIEILRQIANSEAEAGKRVVRHFEEVISEKNRVSYEGEVYRQKEIDSLWKHLERFRAWARPQLLPI